MDEKISSLANEIQQLKEDVKSNQNSIQRRLDTLMSSMNHDSKPNRPSEDDNRKKARKPPLRNITLSPKPFSYADIDRQLGNVYGCFELRDAIREAQTSMVNTDRLLKKVRDTVKAEFLVCEINHTTRTLDVLSTIFNRLLTNMENPDESSIENSEFEGEAKKTSK